MKAPSHLTTEYQSSPLALDVPHPRLAWIVDAIEQTAYQVQASSSPGGNADLWDSGRIESSQSVAVPYGGPIAATVYWRVRTWNESGEASDWSDLAMFGTLPSDLSPTWIGGAIVGAPRSTAPLPILRREFTIGKEVASARLFVSALGLYEARLNGRRVGDDVLTPGWTDYRKRVRVQAYDVAELLVDGDNCIGAFLGDGWYCGNVEWRGRQLYGDRPWLFAELRISYADGSTETISTGPDWSWTQGPVVEGDLLMGESFDARLEPEGWDLAGFDDSKWWRAKVGDVTSPLVGTGSPMPKRMHTVGAISVRKIDRWPSPDYIVDLGQNITGWARVTLRGKAGTTIRLRFAEVLDEKQNLYTTNLRSARQTDYVTLPGGEEPFVWEPKFSFHGFRYVEIHGLGQEPALTDVEGVVVYSNLEATGEFTCSDPLVDQLQRNIVWGQRGNFVDVPTDCPQRDERLGWTGDAQVFAATSAFNMRTPTFWEKYVQDLEDSQDAEGHIPPTAPNTGVVGGDGGPAWADAFVIVPWETYLAYGDETILRRHYDAMTKFVSSLENDSIGLIRSHPDFKGFRGFGDWLSTNAETPHDLIGTAFFAYDLELMSKIARVLGKTEDASEFDELRGRVVQAWRGRFLTPEGLPNVATQTAALLALRFDLVEEAGREKIADWLVSDIRARDNHLSTGFVGTPYINHILTWTEHNDVAYELLLQKSWPSWLYPVTKGATTIWERWDGWTEEKGFQDPGMNSFNHYAYGAVGDWMVKVIAGINPSEPGFKKASLAPLPGGGLTSASASLETGYGRLASSWRIEGDEFLWDVEVPANTKAVAVAPPEFGGVVVPLAPGKRSFKFPRT